MRAIAAAPRLRLVMSESVTDIRDAKDRRDAGRRPIDASASDELLLGAIGKGDRAAMSVLFRRHQTRVFRFILRMVRERASAEDVLSDVFLDVWLHADRFAGRSTVSTWLLGIARHKALTARGARRVEQLDEEVARAIPDPAPDPERALAESDRAALLRRSLDAVTPEHREIIDLVYVQGKSIGEIAGLLHIPPNTVKTRMFYARKRLAALVAASACSGEVDTGSPTRTCAK
jgi:RNA polymerase sigma-70 factor (ECF subfamily)